MGLKVWISLCLAVRMGFCCDFEFKINHHGQCGQSVGPLRSRTLIEFPEWAETWIRDVGCRCLEMGGGRVRVRSRIRVRDLQVFYRIKVGGSRAEPRSCQNPDFRNCGGYGSCISCDVCEQLGQASAETRQELAQITKHGKKMDCGEPLEKGEHEDIRLSVCLPSKDRILQLLDPNLSVAADIWNTFVDDVRGVPVVIFAWIFDEPVNFLPELELQRRIRRTKRGLIGCHWFYGRIKDS